MLRRQRSFYCDETVPLIIPEPMEGIDIDTEIDWRIAEVMLKMQSQAKQERNK